MIIFAFSVVSQLTFGWVLLPPKPQSSYAYEAFAMVNEDS
jgi:hypothetical protein